MEVESTKKRQRSEWTTKGKTIAYEWNAPVTGWVTIGAKVSGWVSMQDITLLTSLAPCSSTTRSLSMGTSKRSSHTKSTVIHSAHMRNRFPSVSGYDMAAAKQKASALLGSPVALFRYLASSISWIWIAESHHVHLPTQVLNEAATSSPLGCRP